MLETLSITSELKQRPEEIFLPHLYVIKETLTEELG